MKAVLYALIVMCIFTSLEASAQSMERDTFFPKMTLDQVVISASKTEDNHSRIVQEVRVIDKNQIQFLQAQTTADLLQSSGSLFVQKSQQGGGSPGLRGFEANRILLMVDGVRMNNLIYRGGHLQNVISLDNNSLDRVEVLYGPSSTIYGSDALGGVLHFYTKKPILLGDDNDSKISGNALVRYSSANSEKTGHFDLQIPGKKLASFTSATYSSFGDLKMGKKINAALGTSFGERLYYVDRINGKDSLVANPDKYNQVFSGYNQYDIVQKFLYNGGGDINHGLNIQVSNTTDVPRYDRLTDPNNATGLAQAEWYYGPQKRWMVAYDMDKMDGTNASMHIGVNYQNIEESRHTRRFGRSNLASRIEKVNVFGANLGFIQRGEKSRLSYGVDLHYNNLSSTAMNTDKVSGVITPLDTRYPDGDNTVMTAEAYMAHNLSLNDRLSLTDGVRLGYSSLKSTFVDKTFFPFPFDEVEQQNLVYSANAGLAFNPTSSSKIAFGVSTGFRSPNIDDMSKVFESGGGNIIVPNPDLKPEKTINIDLNGAFTISEKVKWQGYVFYTLMSNAIVSSAFTFNGQDSILYDGVVSKVFANQNQRKAKIVGFSSTLSVVIMDNLQLDGNMSYTKGETGIDEYDKPLDHIPPFMFRAGLSYALGPVKAVFYALYSGWKRIEDFSPGGEDNQPYAPAEGMPSWYTLNFKSTIKLHNNFELAVGVENILDLQYRTFASGINSPGRNLSASLLAKF